MDKTFTVLAAVLVAGIVIASAAVLSDFPFETDRVPVEDVEEFSVTFELDGGSFPGAYPDSYFDGTYVDLPEPVRDGMRFLGWYSDSGLTEPKPAILPSDRGDLTFYAGWTEGSVLGLTLSTSFHDEFDTDDSLTCDGTTRTSYLTEDGPGRYYTVSSTDAVYSDGKEFSDEYGSWTGSDPGYMYVGNEVLDGKVCAVFSDGVTTGWYYEWLLPMKVVVSEYPKSVSVLEDYAFGEPDLSMEMDVWVHRGAEVTGELPTEIGSYCVLKADDGYPASWYADGSKVSDSGILVVEFAEPFTTYVMDSERPYNVLQDTSVDMSALGFGDGAFILDSEMGFLTEAAGTVELEPGLYYFAERTGGICWYDAYVVEEKRSVSLAWEYGGKEYAVSGDLLLSRVLEDYYGDTVGWRHYMPENASRFLSPENAYVDELADRLSALRGDLDDRCFAELVLKFVQDVPFKYDTDTHGTEDFWQYPGETLWIGGGDCEDSSILYASLMNRLGYQTCIIVMPTHAMAGIVLEDQRDTDDTFVHDGITYTYAETTNSNIGFWAVSDKNRDAPILSVHTPEGTFFE